VLTFGDHNNTYFNKGFLKYIAVLSRGGKVEENEMGRACGAYSGEGRGVHRILVGKPDGKRPLRRPRRRWEDNIKMDIQEVGGDCGDWMELVQDRDRWRHL
jgi:hypothetical protein